MCSRSFNSHNRGGSRTEPREKLSCDAVLTDTSANHTASYEDGMKLQRCCGLGLYPAELVIRCRIPGEGEVVSVR